MPRFQYKQQQFQQDAVKSVIDVFRGVSISHFQQPSHQQYTLTPDQIATVPAPQPQQQQSGAIKLMRQAFGGVLTNNIKEIQERNGIRQTGLDSSGDYLVLDTQMETGTGKTFTFINTIFELHKQYGLTHFVVIVPSIAIKEGIKKSFDTTQAYFERLYRQHIEVHEVMPGTARKKRKSPPPAVMNFTYSQQLTVLIMTNHSFNRPNNLINQELEGFYSDSGRTPMDAIAAKYPVLIIDEPQRADGEQTARRIKDFNPLFVLRYSATFKQGQITNPVYILDSYDAFSQKLVKNITVTDYKVGAADAVFLGVRNLSAAQVELEAVDTQGRHKTVRTGVEQENTEGALFTKTQNAEYRNLRVTTIDQPNHTVTFSDGRAIKLGEYTGRQEQNDRIITEIMLRETIDKHLHKERELFDRGIKCLSLIFIDRVKNYRNYEADNTAGYLQPLFEQCYKRCVDNFIASGRASEGYRQYLQQWQPADTHGGYFSGDPKRNIKIDKGEADADKTNETARSLQQEISQLILRDKEEVLRPNNKLRFIFAHSALREGWDNPNVFQICKLRTSYSNTDIVQEVGRGLRICVNDRLERQDEESIGSEFTAVNRLDIFTLGNGKFISQLQTELSERRSAEKAELATIKSETLQQIYSISSIPANRICVQLYDAGCIDENNNIIMRADAENVYTTIENILTENELDASQLLSTLPARLPPQPSIADGRGGGSASRRYRVNEAQYEKFKELWKLLHQKVIYQVRYDENFQTQIIAKINEIDSITPLRLSRYTTRLNTQKGEFNQDTAQESVASHEEILTSNMSVQEFLNQLAEKTSLPRNSIIRILSRVDSSQYKKICSNPFLAIEEVTAAINSVIYQNIIDKIRYHKVGGLRESETTITLTNKEFTAQQYIELNQLPRYEENNLWEDIAPYDSIDPEKAVSENALADGQITVFAKIPRAVNIPSPLHPKGINPDFAFVVRGEEESSFYFIAEAKPTTDVQRLRREEKWRVELMKKYFEGIDTSNMHFKVISNYNQLLSYFQEARGQQ